MCLAPCAATHIYIAAIHIKKTTSNNKDDKKKLGLRSNYKLGLFGVCDGSSYKLLRAFRDTPGVSYA